MIKLFITDIDGCLTNGQIYYQQSQDAVLTEGIKSFNVLDGAAILRAQAHGRHIAIISGRSSKTLEQRAKDLKVQHIFMGVKDKLSCAQKLADSLNIDLSTEAAMLGDDLVDLELLKTCAYAFVPNDARRLFGIRLNKAGGAGCLDEALEYLCSLGL